MLGRVASEAAEYRLCFRCAQAQCRGILHELIVLLTDETPVDGTREHRLEVRVGVLMSGAGAVQLLGVDALESGQQLKAQEMTEGEGHLALPMAVHVVLLDTHLGAVPQHSLDHRRHLAGRATLELGVDAHHFLSTCQ